MKRQCKYGKALWTKLPGAKVSEAKKSKRLRSESPTRSRERRIYNKLRAEFLAQNPRCARCGMPSSCVHHWAGRRSNYLRVETWKGSCDPCNMFAKNDPKSARAEGWIAPLGVYLT